MAITEKFRMKESEEKAIDVAKQLLSGYVEDLKIIAKVTGLPLSKIEELKQQH